MGLSEDLKDIKTGMVLVLGDILAVPQFAADVPSRCRWVEVMSPQIADGPAKDRALHPGNRFAAKPPYTRHGKDA